MDEKNTSVLPPVNSPSEKTQVGSIQQIASDPEPLIGPSSKDIMIGFGILLALTIISFFIRNAFINYLSGKDFKRSPNNASMAGWCLFGGLFFLSVLACLGMVAKIYLTAVVIYPLSVLSIIFFVLGFMIAAKK